MRPNLETVDAALESSILDFARCAPNATSTSFIRVRLTGQSGESHGEATILLWMHQQRWIFHYGGWYEPEILEEIQGSYNLENKPLRYKLSESCPSTKDDYANRTEVSLETLGENVDIQRRTNGAETETAITS